MSLTTSECTSGSFSKQSTDMNGKNAVLSRDMQNLSKATGVLASDAAHLVQENAARYYDQGIIQAKKLKQGIEDQVQKNPLRSLLVVAGVGLILGALWNRR